jgi:flagellin
MSRIGLTFAGIEMKLLQSLVKSDIQIAASTLRMATGHKINSPADNVSAFTQLSKLQTQMTTVTATLTNATASSSLMTQTQTALSSIQTQLGTIRTELLKDVNHTLTPDQRAESQAKIDTAISTINSLSGTQISGKTPLSGSADYQYSGRNNAQVSDVKVYSLVKQGQSISGSVTTSATKAALTYQGNASNQVTDSAAFTLSGSLGDVSITATAGDTLDSVAANVNNNSYLTGVTAAVNTDHQLVFSSVNYGSQAKSQITVTGGAFITTGSTTGTNASGVINGQTIEATSSNVSGNRFSVNQNGFSFSVEFQSGFTGAFDQINVDGGGLNFALSPSLTSQTPFAIPGMSANQLGGQSGMLNQLASGGSLSGLGNNTSQALLVIDQAGGQATQVQGSVTGFQNSAIASSSALMTSMQTNLQKMMDSIDKTNDTEESSKISYYRGLADNAVSSMTILNQQRQSMVDVLKFIATSRTIGW